MCTPPGAVIVTPMPTDEKQAMSAKRLAGIAGGLYLAMCVLGAGAHLGVRADVRVADDAAATVANIAANATVFRLALVADIVMATIFVCLGVVLHRLFRDVDRPPRARSWSSSPSALG